MRNKDLIEVLKSQGVLSVNGRALSRCLKSELESAINRWTDGDSTVHISNSQIDTYLRCGRQWAYRYILNLKSPPSGSLTTGSSAHESLALNFEQKKETGNDLAFSDIEGKFEAEMKERKDETVWEDDLSFDVALVTGAKALDRRAISPASSLAGAGMVLARRFTSA